VEVNVGRWGLLAGVIVVLRCGTNDAKSKADLENIAHAVIHQRSGPRQKSPFTQPLWSYSTSIGYRPDTPLPA